MTFSISYREVDSKLSSTFSSTKSGFSLEIAGKKSKFQELYAGEAISLGRNTEVRKRNQIDCNHQTISRTHAQITLRPDGVFELMDCSSKFGTFVNGLKLDIGVPYLLKHGDHIKLGYAQKIVFKTSKTLIETVTAVARSIRDRL